MIVPKGKHLAVVPANTLGRDFVVGDIHGCVDALFTALEIVGFNVFTDRVFSVGDLIDRGNQNFEALELCFEPWFFPVKANHEDLMINALVHRNSNSYDTWSYNGGVWHRRDVERAKLLAESIQDLPEVMVVGEGASRFNVVHAELIAYDDKGFPVKVTDQMIDEEDDRLGEHSMLWGREIIYADPSRGHIWHDKDAMSITFVGHTPLDEPVRVGQQVYIDTGCVFDVVRSRNVGGLTIAEPAARKLTTYNSTTDVYTERQF